MNTGPHVPAYLINLDRRPDRLAFMANQLDGIGCEWHRISALDMEIAKDSEIAAEVKLEGHRIGMARGSQCCAVTNFRAYRLMIEQNLPAVLILQDDVEISNEIVPFLQNLDWLPDDVGIVQFEFYGSDNSRRLTGPRLAEMPVRGRSLHRLYSRTAGAGCYLITRGAAERILREKPILDVPIDHFLFSPNVSPMFEKLGVSIVIPALAQQKTEAFHSDISAERKRRPKGWVARFQRLYLDLNRLPIQFIRMLLGARWTAFKFRMLTQE